jgi:thiamine-monophosphate kinase
MNNPGITVGELGEFELIDQIQKRLATSSNSKVSVGIGDDSAVVSASGNQAVACVDVLSQGVHFRLDWSSANEVGRKAAAANLADIYAMGASPTALLVGLALPETTEVSWVLELADGLAQEASKVNVQVVGGDIVRSEIITISVTALGELEHRNPILRSGANPGDTIAVAGKLGFSAAGYLMLSRGFRSPRALVGAHRAPEPPYELAALAHKATSMIDISDGLLSDAGHIAKASNVQMHIKTSELVVAEDLSAAASAFSGNALDWVLNGGEDHAFLATFSSPLDVPTGWLLIGTVKPGEPGVYVDDVLTSPKGWDHFKK